MIPSAYSSPPNARPFPDTDGWLVDPITRLPLAREGDAYVANGGERYAIENGVVRMLRNVDPDLARELEAQAEAIAWYKDPVLLLPRYEPDMARLAVQELFGGGAPQGRILDVGCGIGLLGRLYPELGLVGLDASFSLLAEVSAGYRLLIEASAEKLPFADQSFDVVIALNMLHHVIRPEAAVREFARVLRPAGTLIAVDPRKILPIEIAKQVLRREDAMFAPTHKAFGVAEYDALVRQAGLFDVEDSRRVGLITLLAMGGLDALQWSRRFRSPERVAETLRSIDRLLFRVPGVARAGLNLALRATRTSAAL